MDTHTHTDPRETRLRQRAQFIKRLRQGPTDITQRIIQSISGERVMMNGKDLLLFCSYSYLGLGQCAELYEQALELARPYLAGTGGTRIVCGSTALHAELERELADWIGTEEAVLLPSGYSANSTLLSALAQQTDGIYADVAVHTSIKDGLSLAGRSVNYHAHADMAALEALLAADHTENRFVVVDGVYSMDGDICDLPALKALCEKYQAYLYLDDAHGLGVLGLQGSGTFSHYGVPVGPYDLFMGTISKCIPSIGGFAAGTRVMMDAVRGNCRAYIFSSATPPLDTAMALVAVRHIREHPQLMAKLWANQAHYLRQLHAAGLRPLCTQSPILPLPCRDNTQAFAITHYAEEHGLMVLPAVFPAVAVNKPRIRTTLTASMSTADIEHAVSVLAEAFHRTGGQPTHF